MIVISTRIQIMSPQPTTNAAYQAQRRRIQSPAAATSGSTPSTSSRIRPGIR